MDDTIAILENKLNEARTVVRVYEVRAQIVSVGFIFALGILIDFESRVPKEHLPEWLAVMIIWLVAMLPITLFGYVIYPLSAREPFLYSNNSNDDPDFHCRNADEKDVNATVLAQVALADRKIELSAELRRAEMLK